jgi:hypothetical protein
VKLLIQEIGFPLSDPTVPVIAPDEPSHKAAAEHSVWHDSSLELGRGLDVVELNVDLLLADLELPPARPDAA